MVFARLRKRFAEQDWFAVAIELAIVGVGVFLGLQANTWNEARVERIKARDYHVRLIEDLRATERMSRASIDYYRQVRAYGLAALAGFDRPGATLGVPFLNDAYQATQLYPRSGKHATYDEILASGNAELIGSSDVRERLANFYWRMDGLLLLVSTPPPFRDRLRGVMPYAVTSAIRTHCDETIHEGERGEITPRLRDICPITLDPTELATAVAAIQDAPGLKEDLNRTLIDLDAKLLQYGKIERHAREMRAYLAAHS